MTIFRKTGEGLFAPVTALSINDDGAFKSVVAAWVNDGGAFKKVFSNIVYEDPAADYNMAGASSPSLTRTQTSESSIQNAFVINGQIIPLKSNLTANNIDVDWSVLDIIAIDTQEALPFGIWSTSSADEMWISVELKGGVLTNTRMNGVVAAVNLSNYCPPPRDWKVRLSSGANGTEMYIKYGWFDYSTFYGRQIGIRWRWHSLTNGKYYEHIFTNGNMVLNALN